MADAALDLARLAERLQHASLRPAERRRYRRMPMALSGRILDGAGREHPCRTADISPGDARVVSPSPLHAGERVVIYLDQIGRVAGHVARACSDQDYAVIFDVSPHKREKLAEVLTFMASRARLGLQDEQIGPRGDGREAVTIAVDGGPTFDGEALDASLVGMTIRTAWPPPPIGAWVRVGQTHGRVSRHIERGFEIDFRSTPLER